MAKAQPAECPARHYRSACANRSKPRPANQKIAVGIDGHEAATLAGTSLSANRGTKYAAVGDMLKSDHRRPDHRKVAIDRELFAVREIARQLRADNPCTPAVRIEIGRLLHAELGPAPFIELFNWSQVQAQANQAVEPLRDALYELIRLCARIQRYCTAAIDHPDDPLDWFDQTEIADQLEQLADNLNGQVDKYSPMLPPTASVVDDNPDKPTAT